MGDLASEVGNVTTMVGETLAGGSVGFIGPGVAGEADGMDGGSVLVGAALAHPKATSIVRFSTARMMSDKHRKGLEIFWHCIKSYSFHGTRPLVMRLHNNLTMRRSKRFRAVS
jgi:hypothetical protein